MGGSVKVQCLKKTTVIATKISQLWPDFAEIGRGKERIIDLSSNVVRLSPDFGEVGPQLAT